MAAAEYFNPSASMNSLPATAPQQQQQQQHQQPAPPNPVPAANLNPPYPMSDQPPPYSHSDAGLPRPHSQPPPGQRVPQADFNAPAYAPYRPSQNGQPSADTHQYPPEKLPPSSQHQRAPAFQNAYRPSEYPNAYPPPPQQNGYPTPVAPGLSQVYAGQTWPQQRPGSSGNPGYQRPSRSRSRSREKRKHHKQKPELQRQKSKGMNTFLGAGGGAIIGDLIFPGLGTLSGALLGGIGGHEYGKKRSSSNPSRTYRRSYSSGEEDYRRGRK